jgi:hypothetical protein
MFSRSVMGSARFLRMTPAARLLYYDLGMEADDDGCVEAFGVLRKTGAQEQALEELVDKGFVRLLNDDLACYITDWKVNNQIRKERYHPGIYRALLDDLMEAEPPRCHPTVTQLSPKRHPNVTQLSPEISLGKTSIGQSSPV